jgi:transcription elongation factor GreA-like protein
MIDEKFLLAAVNIKKTYIRLLSNLDLYEAKAKETLEKLGSLYDKLGVLEKDIKKPENINNDNYSSVNEVLKILTELENEGIKLKSFTDPLNKKIENLALEEQELYKQICMKHSDMTEGEIVECVRKRLEKENLS